MELNDRIYELSVQGNLEGQRIKVMVNGKEVPIGDDGACLEAKHVFKELEFETGKMRGYSILEFYTVKDGFLVDKEGNEIHFSSERFPEIKINRIKKPLIIFSEEEVTRDWVRDTGKLMNLEKTEETVKGLSAEDKKVLQDEREVVYAEIETKKKEAEAEEAQRLAEEEAKAAEEAQKLAEEEETKKNIELAKKAEEDAKKAEEDAKAAEAAAEKARQDEEEAKAQAERSAAEAKKAEEEEAKRREEEEKKYIMSEKEYERISKKFTKLGMKEYVKDQYHFFHGGNQEAFVLSKIDGGRYKELEGGIVDEDDQEVEFEFTDGTDKTLTLDLNTEDIFID